MAQWIREMSVGEWFQAADQTFEIIGVDAAAGIVLVQYFDGALEELDFDSWLELNARPCAPPEDYRGALDMEYDEYLDQATPNGNWDSAIDQLGARLDDY